jgi:hypothetical protein
MSGEDQEDSRKIDMTDEHIMMTNRDTNRKDEQAEKGDKASR